MKYVEMIVQIKISIVDKKNKKKKKTIPKEIHFP